LGSGLGVGALPAGQGIGEPAPDFITAAGGRVCAEYVDGSSESKVIMCRERSGTEAIFLSLAAVIFTGLGLTGFWLFGLEFAGLETDFFIVPPGALRMRFEQVVIFSAKSFHGSEQNFWNCK
jgi:hypothetical protein